MNKNGINAPLLILIFLLYQIGCDEKEDTILIEEKKYCTSYGKVVYKMKQLQESLNPQNLD